MSSVHSAQSNRSGGKQTPPQHVQGAPLSLQQHQYEQHYLPESPAPDYMHSQAYDLENAIAANRAAHQHPQEVEDSHHDKHARADARSPSNTYPDNPMPTPRSRGALFREKVMGMATVRTLRILWGLLAVFGTISWLCLMPAFAFRNKLSNGFSNPAYSFFLAATVTTSIAATWQSLCPVLIQLGQGSIWPRIIDHPATQAGTIVLSAILAILNFFSWIVLAANKDGAKTNCNEGALSHQDGYAAQCRGVNAAIFFDAIVFLLWVPIAMVIVCGLIETMKVGHRGGPYQGSGKEEYDLKGTGASHGGYNASMDNVSQLHHDEAHTHKPGYVTPIASQYALSERGDAALESGEGHQSRSTTPQHLQPPGQRLRHKTSNASLASRFSGIFGQGWNSGPMPPPPSTPAPEPMQTAQPTQPRQAHLDPTLDAHESDKASVHGDAYVTQWHSRRQDDWS